MFLFLFICHFLLPSFVFESSSFYCTTGVNFLFLTSPIYMLTSPGRGEIPMSSVSSRTPVDFLLRIWGMRSS